jgi:hypothetical protein
VSLGVLECDTGAAGDGIKSMKELSSCKGVGEQAGLKLVGEVELIGVEDYDDHQSRVKTVLGAAGTVYAEGTYTTAPARLRTTSTGSHGSSAARQRITRFTSSQRFRFLGR